MKEKSKETILDIENLSVNFKTDTGIVRALNGVSFSIKRGQAVGIVGESGCGKSVTASSILRLLPANAEIASGAIDYHKENETIDITKLRPGGKAMKGIRGAEISMIFQEPMTAFSPVHTIGNQIAESILTHTNATKAEAREKVVELLRKVGISNPEQRVDEYPFQYSGGMRQRAMIAMGLACNPNLLIADEPTTALDVTTQAQVLSLIKHMQRDFRLSLILITHDLGVVAHMVDYVNVMYLGRIVESAPVEAIFKNPAHPYTQDLLESIPKITGTKGKLATIKGSIPDPYSLPQGCPFHPRCNKIVGPKCERGVPPLIQIGPEHYVSCYRYD